MLEGVAVVLRVIIELIRVRKEIASGAERIGAAYVRTRQSDALRLVNSKYILGAAIKRFPDLVTDVRVRILIRNYLHSILHSCGAMVCGEHQGESLFGRAAQQFVSR